MRTCRSDAKGDAASGYNREGQSTDAEHRGGAASSRDEGPVMGLDQRGCIVQPKPMANRRREEPWGKERPLADTPMVGHREPYEPRGSRTVLGERGGEIPPRHSTKAAVRGHHF